MIITDDNSIGTLTCVYTTSVSTVLICESAPGVDIDYWNVYVNDIFYAVANNSDVEIDISHMYFRLLELDRETEYTAYVVGVKDGVGISADSNTITFSTFPE